MKFLLVLTCLLVSNFALADSFEGKVVAVSDGDTVKVLRQGNVLEKIRLLGIDAPEKNQDFGQKSKEALTTKIAGKQVKVEFSKRDRYGRLLGKILLNNEDVNLTQVKDGLAWHYKQYSKEQAPGDAAVYSEAEVLAKGKTLGLWSIANVVAPWEFRQERKVASQKARKSGKPRKSKRERKKKYREEAPAVSF